MYFELDESLAHSSLNFLLELATQLQKYIWILGGPVYGIHV